MDTYPSILHIIWLLKISPTAWHCVVKSWCMPLMSHLNYASNFTHIMFALYVLVPSAPQRLRVLTKTTSQIKITWEAPAISNGVLRGYQVDVRGKKWFLYFNDVWGFLFLNQTLYSQVGHTTLTFKRTTLSSQACPRILSLNSRSESFNIN